MLNEAHKLEQFINSLRSNPAAPIPAGLDPQLAEFVRHYVRLQPSAHLDPLAVQRIWQRALEGAGFVEKPAPRDNNRGPFQIVEHAIEEDIPMTTIIRPMSRTAHSKRGLWALLAATALALIFLGGLLPSLLRENDPGAPVTVISLTEQQNKVAFLRYIEEAWNEGNTTTLDEVLVPVMHSCYAPGLFPKGAGIEYVAAMIGNYRTAFPDWQFTIESISAEDDEVWAWLTGTGTHSGPFTWSDGTIIEPNGNTVSVNVMINAQFVDSRIIVQQFLYDSQEFLGQLNHTFSLEVYQAEQRNAAAARQLMEALWTRPDWDTLDEMVAFPQTWCYPTDNCMLVTNQDWRDVWQEWTEAFLTSFPDLEVETVQVVAKGDTVTVEQQGKGHFRAELWDMLSQAHIPPTNRIETWSVLVTFTFNEEGKITHEKWYWYWKGWPPTPSLR